MYHSILSRQIKKYLGEKPLVSKELEGLLQAVSQTYTHFDEGRILIERSLDISSREIEEEKNRVEELVVKRTRELREQEANLSAAIKSIPLGFLLIDPDQHILVRNEVVKSILELDDSDYQLSHVINRFQEQEMLNQKIIDCNTKGRESEIEEIGFGKKILRILLASIQIKEEQGKSVLGCIMLVEDITERKVLERSKDEFFSIASHELRTPLTVIQGNANILLSFYGKNKMTPEMVQMVNDISSSTEHLIKIVNDFLDVSRLEQGRGNIKIEKLDLVSAVDEVVRRMRVKANEKQVKLKYSKPLRTYQVIADSIRLEQVLVNLIGNALKFTQKGSVSISLSRVGNYARVSIKDTGAGIPISAQSLLFRKFQQAGKHLLARDVKEGTGLGLYISKMIVESMGGKIQLDSSTIGKGSSFSFTLPMA